MKKIILLLLVAFGCVSIVHAQQCPPGQVMQGEQSGPGWRAPICIPDGNSAAAPSPPPEIWEDRWGAIAYDKKTGMTGVAIQQKSESQATNIASNNCLKKETGIDCKIVLIYRNQCAAAAAGTKGGGFARDTSLESAENKALDSCNQLGGLNCKIAYTDCSLPVRVQ